MRQPHIQYHKKQVKFPYKKYQKYDCDWTYTKIFNERPLDLNWDANFFTDSIELRSNSIASTLAAGISLTIASLTSFPAGRFLTPIKTCTPRSARTRAVSVPIPLEAPAILISKNQVILQVLSCHHLIYKSFPIPNINAKSKYRRPLSKQFYASYKLPVFLQELNQWEPLKEIISQWIKKCYQTKIKPNVRKDKKKMKKKKRKVFLPQD